MKFKQGPAERIGYVSTPSVLHGVSKKELVPRFFPTRQPESRSRAVYKRRRFKIKSVFLDFRGKIYKIEIRQTYREVENLVQYKMYDKSTIFRL